MLATLDVPADERRDREVLLGEPAAVGMPEGRHVLAQFTPNGDHVLAVFANGRGYRWNIRPSAWNRHACKVAARRLSREEWSYVLPDRDYAPTC